MRAAVTDDGVGDVTPITVTNSTVDQTAHRTGSAVPRATPGLPSVPTDVRPAGGPTAHLRVRIRRTRGGASSPGPPAPRRTASLLEGFPSRERPAAGSAAWGSR